MLVAVSAAAFAGDQPHWTYEGHEGPEHWAELTPDFAACKGNQQSPVDLTAASAGDNVDLALDWKPFAPTVTNNGHTIQAAAAGTPTTTLGGKVYTLQQMHFHHPAEHAIGGRRAPMEAHFVNKGPDGRLLVLGVMIEEGAANGEIAKLWEVVPAAVGAAPAKADVDFAKLLPTGGKFYRYAGSLTTPPCSEIVEWIVFADPITASKEQVAAFAKLYPINSRPVQVLHERTIVLGR